MNLRRNSRAAPRVKPIWAVACFALALLAVAFLVFDRVSKPPRSFPAVQPMAAAKPDYVNIIRESLREGVQLTGRSYEVNGDTGSIYVCLEIKGQPMQTGATKKPPADAPLSWAVWHVKDPATLVIQSAEPIARGVSTLNTDDTPPDVALKLQKTAKTQSAQK